MIAIIVVSKSRIHAAEPLAGVHATSGVAPYTIPLNSDTIDFVYLNLLVAPYEAPPGSSGEGGGGSGGHRRLASWVGEAVAARDGAAGAAQPLGGGPLVERMANAQLQQHVAQLLAKPKRTLSHRRALHDVGSDEPSDVLNDDDGLPQLRVRQRAVERGGYAARV